MMHVLKLDALDRHEANQIPEGYALSMTYVCVLDACQCISEAIFNSNASTCADMNK
ncbi:unnamed protein product, partial [Anisakis simplex]|uniref:Uncharacterized protein n=1 Tax=Anisakis simplex TaxID=6269 RepID=A0A0M3JLE0_ANISI